LPKARTYEVPCSSVPPPPMPGEENGCHALGLGSDVLVPMLDGAAGRGAALRGADLRALDLRAVLFFFAALFFAPARAFLRAGAFLAPRFAFFDFFAFFAINRLPIVLSSSVDIHATVTSPQPFRLARRRPLFRRALLERSLRSPSRSARRYGRPESPCPLRFALCNRYCRPRSHRA
jgi:hypothetical protein